MQSKKFNDGINYCLFDEKQIEEFTPNMLTPQYWHEKGAITGSAQGRGTTWFVQYKRKSSDEFKHWVLRHYYRGGIVGKLLSDSYLYTSQKNTRAAKEFALLAHMQTLELPAPKPIAYKISRHGFFYRADLLSSRIINSQDLVAILSDRVVSDNLWKEIGKTIKHFHDHNIYHHDLNAHNILIDAQNNVYLIDFDRCEIRATNQGSWQKSNMARLQRSFLKEAKQLSNFHWNMENWRLLLEGYLRS